MIPILVLLRKYAVINCLEDDDFLTGEDDLVDEWEGFKNMADITHLYTINSRPKNCGSTMPLWGMYCHFPKGQEEILLPWCASLFPLTSSYLHDESGSVGVALTRCNQ